MKFIITVLLIFPFLGQSQGFSPPRNNVNVSNKLFSQQNQLMQHQHLMKTLQNKVAADEETLVTETNKKESAIKNNEELNSKLNQLNDELATIENDSNHYNDEKLKKTAKIKKEISATQSKINLNSKKIEISKKKIENLEKRVEASKKELEEKKKKEEEKKK